MRSNWVGHSGCHSVAHLARVCGRCARRYQADGIARVIFAFDGGTIVLLNGFVKKTRKTPPAEIDLALKRLKEMTS